ncbi:MAG: hypothetical protein ACXWAT_14365 [Methylobacter sp.]
MYKQSGFEIDVEVPGSSIQTEMKIDITDAPYAALYAFIDEYIIVLLRAQSVYFLTADHKKHPSAIIFYRLSIRQLRTLTSIRILCSYGLDTNARFQLRSMYETALLWVRFRIDKDCLAAYAACNSAAEANKFWHNYLSKEKTERYLRDNLTSKGFNWPGMMEEQIADLKQKLSLVAHPTFLADWHETLTDWNDISNNVVVSNPSKSSHVTLSHAILITIMPFTIIPDPPYDLSTTLLRDHRDLVWNPIPHQTNSWEEYNQLLRNMFPTLFLMAVRFFEEFDKDESDSKN